MARLGLVGGRVLEAAGPGRETVFAATAAAGPSQAVGLQASVDEVPAGYVLMVVDSSGNIVDAVSATTLSTTVARPGGTVEVFFAQVAQPDGTQVIQQTPALVVTWAAAPPSSCTLTASATSAEGGAPVTLVAAANSPLDGTGLYLFIIDAGTSRIVGQTDTGTTLAVAVVDVHESRSYYAIVSNANATATVATSSRVTVTWGAAPNVPTDITVYGYAYDTTNGWRFEWGLPASGNPNQYFYVLYAYGSAGTASEPYALAFVDLTTGELVGFIYAFWWSQDSFAEALWYGYLSSSHQYQVVRVPASALAPTGGYSDSSPSWNYRYGNLAGSAAAVMAEVVEASAVHTIAIAGTSTPAPALPPAGPVTPTPEGPVLQPAAITVTLEASSVTAAANQPVLLTATASADITATPYTLSIVDTDTGKTLASTQSGTSLVVSAADAGASHTFEARLTNGQVSAPVTVTWAAAAPGPGPGAPPGAVAWHAVGQVSFDEQMGSPPPSIRLPGDRSYVWADPGVAATAFAFDLWTQSLADFFFGCDETGRGYFFRIDTRGGANYSGFATTYSWTAWDAPAAGSVAVPANAWVHVEIAIAGSQVTATANWDGGSATFRLAGQPVFLAPPAGTPANSATIAGYSPRGTAIGFSGDAYGVNTGTAVYSWVADFSLGTTAAPVLAWAVTLTATDTRPGSGETVTLTAQANQAVQGTGAVLLIVDGTGRAVASAGSGSTLTARVSGSGSTATYLAEVVVAGEVVAQSEPLTVSWAPPGPSTATLVASMTQAVNGSPVTLTLTTPTSVSGTGDSLRIVDAVGNIIASATSGTVASGTAVHAGMTVNYYGQILDATGAVVYQTPAVSVSWTQPGTGYLVSLVGPSSSSNGWTQVLTAYSSNSLTGTGAYLQIWDLTHNEVVASTATGTEVQAFVSAEAETIQYQASIRGNGWIGNRSQVITVTWPAPPPAPSLQIAGNPGFVLHGQWASVTLTASATITGTPYSMRLVDVDNGNPLGQTAEGTVLDVAWGPGTMPEGTTLHLQGQLVDTVTQRVVATSSVVTVSWGGTPEPTLSASSTTPPGGQAVTLTASNSVPWGILQIWTSDNTLVAAGTWGQQSIQVTVPGQYFASVTYLAVVGNAIQGSSGYVPYGGPVQATVSWGGPASAEDAARHIPPAQTGGRTEAIDADDLFPLPAASSTVWISPDTGAAVSFPQGGWITIARGTPMAYPSLPFRIEIILWSATGPSFNTSAGRYAVFAVDPGGNVYPAVGWNDVTWIAAVDAMFWGVRSYRGVVVDLSDYSVPFATPWIDVGRASSF